jgi:hypothetical protein
MQTKFTEVARTKCKVERACYKASLLWQKYQFPALVTTAQALTNNTLETGVPSSLPGCVPPGPCTYMYIKYFITS